MKINKNNKKIFKNAIINIITTFNNTIITVSDEAGNTINWSSCGFKGFKGSKKNTPFAAQIASDHACKKAKELGVRNLSIKIKGPGIGREAALRTILNSGIKPLFIKDITGIPHNGCRPPKKRRI